MKKSFATLVLLGVFFFCSTKQVTAVTLSLDPAVQNIKQGNTASLVLNVNGLGNFTPDSLAAFLVEITFDQKILSFDSIVYGAFLGDPLDLLETDIITIVGADYVSLDEFSFLFDFELDALQPDKFTLATLSFNGDAVGTSTFGFGFIDLADAAFPSSSIVVDTLETASITIESQQQPIPEPTTPLLIISGLLGIAASRYRQQSI